MSLSVIIRLVGHIGHNLKTFHMLIQQGWVENCFKSINQKRKINDLADFFSNYTKIVQSELWNNPLIVVPSG